MGDVDDVMARISGQVARLPDAAIGSLRPVLQAAEAELSRDLHKWLTSVKDGELRFTTQQYRNSLLQIRTALAKIAAMEGPVKQTLIDHGHTAGRMATGHIAAELAAFGDHFGHSIRPIPLEVASILAQGDKMLIPRFRNSAARYAGSVGDDIRQMLALGVVRGENIDQLKRRLIAQGGPRGLVALRGKLGDPGAVSEMISEGLFKRYNYWAERVVRTEVLGAYNTHGFIGIADMAESEPGMLKRWDAANDYRVCSLCRSLHEVTVKPLENFPGGYKYPPAHPNCRCAVVAWHAAWGDKATPGGTRAKIEQLADGKVEIKTPALRKPKAKPEPVAKPVPAPPPQPKFDPMVFDSPKKATAWGERRYQDWYNALSGMEQEALGSYTGVGFAPMNRFYRDPDKFKKMNPAPHGDMYKERAANMTAAMAKAQTPEDLLVYRGAAVDLDKLVPGATLRDKGFRSTSLDKEISEKFADQARKDQPKGHVPVLYEIELPKGTKAAYVMNDDEAEMVIQRNSVMRIHSVTYDQERKFHVVRARIESAGPED